MVSVKVNTNNVVIAAANIKTINDQIRDGFSDVRKSISRLDSTWDGVVATNTISKFNEIASEFTDARYNVVDNYVSFLLQQVDEGYAQTEEVNKSLADAFK